MKIHKGDYQNAAMIKKGLEDLKEMMPYIIENETLQAQIKKEKFEALVKNGFTEAQAIELCK